jgi:hypothetical protein
VSSLVASDGGLIDDTELQKILTELAAVLQRYYPDISLEAPRNITKNFNEDSRWPERSLPSYSEYEHYVVARSVGMFSFTSTNPVGLDMVSTSVFT